MDTVSSSTVSAASGAAPGTVQSAAAISVMKKSIDMQVAQVVQLIQALPQPQLLQKPVAAPMGSVGTKVDTFA